LIACAFYRVNVGIVPGLATRGRAEHVKMFYAKSLQIGFVLLQSANSFVSVHEANIANRTSFFHDSCFNHARRHITMMTRPSVISALDA
jgi:hypothetical protein